jgi:hypothetical protein
MLLPYFSDERDQRLLPEPIALKSY